MVLEWDEVRRRTARLVDGLGVPIDAEILDFVTTLRYVGYETILSCGGHADRITGGPYVVIISKKGRSILERDPSDKRNRLLARQATAAEAMSLYELLAKFYIHHQLDYSQQVTLRMIGNDAFRIGCHGADLLDAEQDSERRKDRIRRYRKELDEFSKFILKEKTKEKPHAARSSVG